MIRWLSGLLARARRRVSPLPLHEMSHEEMEKIICLPSGHLRMAGPGPVKYWLAGNMIRPGDIDDKLEMIYANNYVPTLIRIRREKMAGMLDWMTGSADDREHLRLKEFAHAWRTGELQWAGTVIPVEFFHGEGDMDYEIRCAPVARIELGRLKHGEYATGRCEGATGQAAQGGERGQGREGAP